MNFSAHFKRPLVRRLFQLLGPNKARLVGGAVRDAYFGRVAPDIDMATVHRPDVVTRLCEAAGLRVIPTGLDHGTVTIVGLGEVAEVTTLRADVATDGRHAVVVFTEDWTVDAARRDLTINALAVDGDGKRFDYHDGVADLYAGTIRFIGDAERRITEDYLRLLRLFRFWGRFGQNPLDDETLAVVTQLAPGVTALANERVWSELSRLLVGPQVRRTLQQLSACGVDQALWGETLNLTEVDQLAERRRVHGLTPDPVQLLRLLGVTAGLALSSAERKRLKPAAGASLPERLWRFGAVRVAADAALEGASACDWRMIHSWQAPAFTLRGQDLIAAGLVPGPTLGAALKRAEQAWIDSDFTLPHDVLLAVALADPT